MKTKPWYKSKTMQVNGAALLTAAAAVITGQAEWQTALAPVAMAIVNMILRIVTNQPIE